MIFLLRQGVEGRVLNDFIGIWKAMLVRTIESGIAKARGRVGPQEGVAASEAIRAAYCAVAVDCTVRFINERGNSGGKYFNVVKRIWRGRVWKMEKLKKIGLVSDELLSWKNDTKAALWETSACENVRVKSRGDGALEAVRVCCRRVGENGLALALDNGFLFVIIGMQKGDELPRQKHVASKRSRGVISGPSGGIKITDAEELDIKPLALANNDDGLPTPEIGEVQEALRTMDGDAINTSLDESAEAGQSNEANLNNHCLRNQNDLSKTSLMAQNSTACTYELLAIAACSYHTSSWAYLCGLSCWLSNCLTLRGYRRKDSSFSSLQLQRRIELFYQFLGNMAKPDTSVPIAIWWWHWYGAGNWLFIIRTCRDAFEERTEDKWRNMIQY
ncbi:hypothetical protein NMG60_11014402 [Bertholletia excelsa]